MILHQQILSSGEVTTTHEIVNNLAIGPAIHIPHMANKGWTCILVAKECTEDERFPDTCVKIGLKDSRGNDLEDIIDILNLAKQWYYDDKKVMIACGAGRSRAACILAAHMVNCGIAKDMMEALVIIHTVRNEINPNFAILRNVQKALTKLLNTACSSRDG